jgi:hypothetical protein
MKTLLIFMVGIALGWLGSRAFQAADTWDQDQSANSGTKKKSAPQIATIESRTRSTRERVGKTSGYDAAFEARLKLATSRPTEVITSSQPPNDSKFSRWLAGLAVSAQMRNEIIKEFDARLVAGEVDPLTAGSSFDLWLRDRLDTNSLASWTAMQGEHSADQVERRANQLMVGLQNSLSLSPTQKDALFQQLVEWAKEKPANLTAGDPLISEETTRRFNELAPLIPADQHAALNDWIAEYLPSYWIKESINN